MTEHNCDDHGGMFEVPGDRLREMNERIAQLTADLEAAEACADGMQQVARGFEQERDAARRDCERLREALESWRDWDKAIQAGQSRSSALAFLRAQTEMALAQEPASDPQPNRKVDGVLCAKCSHSGWSHDTMTGDCMQCGCRAFKEPASDPQPETAASDERSVGT